MGRGFHKKEELLKADKLEHIEARNPIFVKKNLNFGNNKAIYFR